ncbi:MAG TPA: cytochrome c [Vicinamibacteria bacterium]|nr:cytochrome c [Vicinamibacteria bacterium]
MKTTALLGLGLSISGLIVSRTPGQDPDAIRRGEYVLNASGGCACHTDAAGENVSFSGGRAIKTPFGTIYGTNITPDRETGIGGWSDEDFLRAMREGMSPEGEPYYPVFPYTSFTRMADGDLLDLKAYLFSLPPVRKENREPDFGFPYNSRASVRVWRGLHFEPVRFTPVPARSDEWNRGAYLVEAVAHCGECHTPRTFLGAVNEDLGYAGSVEGPEGELAPNITPDEKTGIGSWSTTDIVWFLQTNLLPDGDGTQGLMAEVIDKGYRHMEESDLKAIAVYLKSLPPIENEVKAQ